MTTKSTFANLRTSTYECPIFLDGKKLIILVPSYDLSWSKLTPEQAGRRFKHLPDTSKPGLTKQEFKNDCDIHTLFDRFARGEIQDISTDISKYYDTTQITDFQTASNIVAQGRETLEKLPSQIRDALRNNPDNLKAFMADPKNYELLRKHGLANEVKPNKVEPLPKADPPPVGKKTPPKKEE